MATENLIDLTAAAKLVPTRPHTATVWRWCRKGVVARSGAQIKLAHRRIGSRIYIDPADLDRFFCEVAESDAEHFDKPAPDAQPEPTSNGRQGSQRHAEATLKRAGIL